MVPGDAIADFKAYASRALNRAEPVEKRWARGGNARELATKAVDAAVRYVVYGQGDAMEIYVAQGGPGLTPHVSGDMNRESVSLSAD
jgi:hypothetical protein